MSNTASTRPNRQTIEMSEYDPSVYAIEAKNVTLTLQSGSIQHQIIDNMSLSVQQGEFVALVGPSGCGKTSFLHVAAGLTNATSGTVSVLGAPPRPDPRQAMVAFARDVLLPWRTIRQNVALPLEAIGLPAATVAARVDNYLRQVGLDHVGDAYRSQLSQGMRQRAALARSLVVESRLLLMDEPFAALDAQTRILMQDVLLRLLTENRRSVLFVTHDLGEAITLADRIIVLTSGPCRVKAVYDVPFSRPRESSSLRSQPEFTTMFDRLWQDLKNEAE